EDQHEIRLGLDEVRVLVPLAERLDLDAVAANFLREGPQGGDRRHYVERGEECDHEVSTSAKARNSVGMSAVRADGVLELQVGGGGPLRLGLRKEGGRRGRRMLGLEVGAQARELAALEGERQADALGASENGAGRDAHEVASDAQEPSARELGDDLRVAAAVPLAVEAVARGKMAEDGLRLQCQGLVPLRDVDGLPLQIQIGTVELRFPAETSAPRIAEGQTGGLARSEVQAPVERPLLAERKERLRFRGERRPR